MRFVFVFVFVFAFAAEAKYVKIPEGVKGKNDWNAEYIFRTLDKDKDGRLSLDEYKKMAMTRDVERSIRQDKKAGIYRTPDEEFGLMDLDGDGYIAVGDLSYYLSHHVEERNEGKKFDYPLKKSVEEVGGKKQEVIEVEYDARYGMYHPQKAIKPIEEDVEKAVETKPVEPAKPAVRHENEYSF